MPNWCNSSVAIDGDAHQVKELNKVLEELENLPEPRVKNGFGNAWLGCLVDAMGKDWKEVDCRGEWFGRSYDEEKNIIRFDCSTAWGPRHLIDTLDVVKEKFSGIFYYYMAEEFGCGVFVNNDIGGEYFPWRYNLDVCNEEESCWEVYETISEVYEAVGEWSGEEISSQKELDAALESLNKKWEEFDGYIYLNEYQYDEENG